MPVCHQDHGGVTVAVAVALGCLDQALDLGLGQILPRPQLGVWPAAWLTVRFSVAGLISLRCDFAMAFNVPCRSIPLVEPVTTAVLSFRVLIPVPF